jgi:hypothetical protein
MNKVDSNGMGPLDGIELEPISGPGGAQADVTTDPDVTGINLDEFFGDLEPQQNAGYRVGLAGAGSDSWTPGAAAIREGIALAPGGIQTSAPRQKKHPPLFAALAVVYKKNLSGTLSVSYGAENILAAVIENGRVMNCAHPDLTPSAISSLLVEMGLISEKQMLRAQKRAAARDRTIEDEIVASRRISRATFENLRETQCNETILSLIMDRNVKVSLVQHTRSGIRKNCSLPLPYLIKEAQRRARELPDILSRVPDNDAIYIRSAHLDPTITDVRWEDLEMSAGERQTYFFVNGRRTVKELASVTSQSLFNVTRSLASLVENGFVVQAVTRTHTPSAFSSFLRSTTPRAFAMLVVLASISLAYLVVKPQDIFHHEKESSAESHVGWTNLLSRASSSRVAGAAFVYLLTRNEMPDSPERLVDEGLILPTDMKAAAMINWGPTLPLDEQPVESPTSPDEEAPDDAQ